MRIPRQNLGALGYLREPMKVQTYRCDYCSNVKGENNDWWLAQPAGEHFTLALWDAALADQEHCEHICSESCATKALSKWMTQRALHNGSFAVLHDGNARGQTAALQPLVPFSGAHADGQTPNSDVSEFTANPIATPISSVGSDSARSSAGLTVKPRRSAI